MSTYIIAEISANHGGSLKTALQTMDAIKECGADAVKIQTYTADTITLDCDKPEFMANPNGLWAGKRLHDLYAEAYTPWEWHLAIFEHAKQIGITCFSTPFDKTAVDLLESVGNPIYKIASPEITDIPLIAYVASKGKPIIISTGVAMAEDVELALQTCYDAGNRNVTLLKCTTAYPAPVEEANLLTMVDMGKRFGVKVGLSDHTMGADVVLAAVALGAEVIEKHFIIDRAMGGVDSAFSMNHQEFSDMVHSIRNVEKALGKVVYPTDPAQIKGRQFSRSLYVALDMKVGDVITEQNVRSVRPGHGLHTKYLKELLGCKVNRQLEKGTPLELIFVEK